MSPDRWSAVLPWPPSNNHYYTVARGRKILSPEGRAYGEAAALACAGQKRPVQPLSGRLGVEVLVSPPDRRRRDLDNMLKPVLDVLTRAGVIEDDGLIDNLWIVRQAPSDGGFIQVSVRVL